MYYMAHINFFFLSPNLPKSVRLRFISSSKVSRKKKARNVFFWKFCWLYTYFPWLNYLIFNQSQRLKWGIEMCNTVKRSTYIKKVYPKVVEILGRKHVFFFGMSNEVHQKSFKRMWEKHWWSSSKCHSPWLSSVITLIRDTFSWHIQKK